MPLPFHHPLQCLPLPYQLPYTRHFLCFKKEESKCEHKEQAGLCAAQGDCKVYALRTRGSHRPGHRGWLEECEFCSPFPFLHGPDRAAGGPEAAGAPVTQREAGWLRCRRWTGRTGGLEVSRGTATVPAKGRGWPLLLLCCTHPPLSFGHSLTGLYHTFMGANVISSLASSLQNCWPSPPNLLPKIFSPVSHNYPKSEDRPAPLSLFLLSNLTHLPVLLNLHSPHKSG